MLDWATRRILSWRLSIVPTTDFCVGAVEEAIATYGKTPHAAYFNPQSRPAAA